MGRYPTKAAGNRYYESRKNAAEHDERLTSREAAGELLGVSWSSLADYERGLTKVPVDVVCRMADLYNRLDVDTRDYDLTLLKVWEVVSVEEEDNAYWSSFDSFDDFMCSWLV